MTDSDGDFEFRTSSYSVASVGVLKALNETTEIGHRCPLWLPRNIYHEEFQNKISSYSEKVANAYAKRKKLLTSSVNALGCYGYSRSSTEDILHVPVEFGGIRCITFSPDDTTYMVGFGGGQFNVYNKSTNEVELTCGHAGLGSAITSIRFKSDTLFFVSTLNGNVYHCDTAVANVTMSHLFTEPNNEINAADINVTGVILATGGKDATVRLYEVDTGRLVSEYRNFSLDCDKLLRGNTDEEATDDEGHFLRIHAIKADPDNPNVLVSGGWDSTIKIWDIRVKEKPVRNIFGPHICGDAIDIEDGKILTGQWACRDSIQLWDMGSSRLLKTVKPRNRTELFHGEFLYCIKFFKGIEEKIWQLEERKGDLVIAGGSGLQCLEVISIQDDLVVAAFPETKPIVAIDQSSTKIIFGGTGNIIYKATFIPSIEHEGGRTSIAVDKTYLLPSQNVRSRFPPTKVVTEEQPTKSQPTESQPTEAVDDFDNQ